MKPSFRLGRIAGVEVGVHWGVLFIVAIVTWSLGAQLLPDTAPGYAGWAYWIAASIAALAFAGSILAPLDEARPEPHRDPTRGERA